MIRSIRHKGLKRLYANDDARGVMADHTSKLRDILARLDAARTVADMDMPGFRLHPLKGELTGLPIRTHSMLITWTTTKRRLNKCR